MHTTELRSSEQRALERPPAEPPAGTSRAAVVERLLMAAVVLVVVVAGWQRRWTSDDAFINFRVVENVLAGHGPVFSAPERVEVATSPLWLWILTAAEALVPGDAVAWSSVVLGMALSAVGVLAALRGAARLFAVARRRLLVPVGALVFVSLPPTWDFITSGLETGLSFAWLGLTFWGTVRWAQADGPVAGRPVWLYVLVGLGPLVRPDLAIVTGLVLLWLTAAATGRWSQRLLGLLAAGLLPAGYQLFRMGYYGLLVPNTAVAKESTRPLWGRGLVYLADLVEPHLLWLPALLALGLLAALAPAAGWRARQWSLVAVVLLAAAVSALYVVRVGGDFMHARLLMPALFLALCPLAAVPLPPVRVWVPATLVGATAVWAVASAAVLRIDYQGQISAAGIADERDFYAGLSGAAHPVTLADHGGAGVGAYTAQVRRLAADGEDIVVEQVLPVTPQTPVSVVARSADGVVFWVGNAGFYGVAAGPDVFVVDTYGLTDPVGSHVEAGHPGRPGHEKHLPTAYLLARYGAAEQPGGADLPPAGTVAAAARALACGGAAELLAAANDPLTWDRFWANVAGAPERTALRIPVNASAAELEFCGSFTSAGSR